MSLVNAVRSAMDLLQAWVMAWCAVSVWNEAVLLDPLNGFAYFFLSICLTSVIGAFKFADVAVADIPHFLSLQVCRFAVLLRIYSAPFITLSFLFFLF